LHVLDVDTRPVDPRIVTVVSTAYIVMNIRLMMSTRVADVPSMSMTFRFGSAYARRPAVTHPRMIVIHGECRDIKARDRVMHTCGTTTADDNINFFRMTHVEIKTAI
jgi:hypothetical protein